MKTAIKRLSLWRTELITLLSLLAYVALVEIIVALSQPSLSGVWLLVVGLLLALVPAGLWLSLFYTQDRHEPEPKSYVLGVALLGGLLAGAIGQPLLMQILDVGSWIGRDAPTEILGSILLIGFIECFLIYAAVRFSVFYSSEFDHRVDGVVYGSAAGLGYAAMLNITMVLNSGGVDLGVGVIRIVIIQMVHAALGAFIGYFLGRDKFDPKRVWWMGLGISVAAVIDGFFYWLNGEITHTPIKLASQGVVQAGYNPWPALILAVLLAAVLLGGIYWLTQTDIHADELAEGGTSTSPREAKPPTSSDKGAHPAAGGIVR